MAKVFLDTNLFIDAVHRKPKNLILEKLVSHFVLISPLSVHIYCYTYKIKIPNEILGGQLKKFSLVDISGEIIQKSLEGPTADLEDNIQLHSSAEAECNYFLTNDKNLLKMKFFGKTQVVNNFI